MGRQLKLVLALCLLCGMHTAAGADGKQSEERGQLLYMAHCSTCHSAQIHWRGQKLVRGWSSLVEQVRRWQNIAELNWSEEEITDVAHYLDAVYYHYENTVQGKGSEHLLRKD